MRWCLRWYILYYVIQPDILPTAILMKAVFLVLMSKVCSLQNRISKNVIIQTVPIYKYLNVRKTITVWTWAPMIHVYVRLRLTITTCTMQGYKTQWCSTAGLHLNFAPKSKLNNINLYMCPDRFRIFKNIKMKYLWEMHHFWDINID